MNGREVLLSPRQAQCCSLDSVSLMKKDPRRHSGESRNPCVSMFFRTPAFAGVTAWKGKFSLKEQHCRQAGEECPSRMLSRRVSGARPTTTGGSPRPRGGGLPSGQEDKPAPGKLVPANAGGQTDDEAYSRRTPRGRSTIWLRRERRGRASRTPQWALWDRLRGSGAEERGRVAIHHPL